eukprot:sb/3464455/
MKGTQILTVRISLNSRRTLCLKNLHRADSLSIKYKVRHSQRIRDFGRQAGNESLLYLYASLVVLGLSRTDCISHTLLEIQSCPKPCSCCITPKYEAEARKSIAWLAKETRPLRTLKMYQGTLSLKSLHREDSMSKKSTQGRLYISKLFSKSETLSYVTEAGTTVEPERHVKDLGVWLSADGTWTYHINDIEVLLTLYKALVRPILEYCCLVWSPTKVADIQALENVQRAFLRKIYGMNELTYWERLETLKIMSLQRRRQSEYRVNAERMQSETHTELERQMAKQRQRQRQMEKQRQRWRDRWRNRDRDRGRDGGGRSSGRITPIITHSLRIRYVFTLEPLCIHCVLLAYSLCIHCVFALHLLCIHCVFTLYSLCKHCVNTIDMEDAGSTISATVFYEHVMSSLERGGCPLWSGVAVFSGTGWLSSLDRGMAVYSGGLVSGLVDGLVVFLAILFYPYLLDPRFP